jgi:hypothetical protein
MNIIPDDIQKYAEKYTSEEPDLLVAAQQGDQYRFSVSKDAEWPFAGPVFIHDFFIDQTPADP